MVEFAAPSGVSVTDAGLAEPVTLSTGHGKTGAWTRTVNETTPENPLRLVRVSVELLEEPAWSIIEGGLTVMVKPVVGT